ncbi:hypothetical protein AMTRI_Chr03g142360 [Amborella trichopoda]
MGCLTLAHFSVLISGSLKGFFKASRGIKQGDALFPFLVTLVAEGFSMMLKNIENKDRLTGFQVLSNATIIFHLQYVDDILIFCDTLIEKLSIFLFCCQMALGLKINFHKTSLVGISCSRKVADPFVGFMWSLKAL